MSREQVSSDGAMSEYLPFTKMQGVGNDFVLVDTRSGVEHDWPRLAVRMCDRHFGIGADGLLLITACSEADVGMRMFNPDGTEDFCGNGLRCVARYVADAEDPRPDTLRIGTLSGVRTAWLIGPDTVRADMTDPVFRPEGIPMRVTGERVLDYELPIENGFLRITALSTGSTHAVVFVDRLPDDDEFVRISRQVENHPLFPERTSLMWTRVESPERLRLRIWERGAGETLGCGTGACAAMIAARLHGYVGSRVAVASEGGEMTVEWEPGGTLFQTGPAEYVFGGRYFL